MISQETIQEAVRRLVKAYDPLEVYLFGTYAWGNPNEDDDLDLLLIIESSNEKIYKRGDRAFDTFRLLQDTTSLAYEVKSRGKILYAGH